MLEKLSFSQIAEEQVFLFEGDMYRKSDQHQAELIRYSTGDEPDQTITREFQPDDQVELIPNMGDHLD